MYFNLKLISTMLAEHTNNTHKYFIAILSVQLLILCSAFYLNYVID